MTNIKQFGLFGEDVIEKAGIDREHLSSILYKLIQDLDLETFVKIFTNEFREVIEYIKLQQGENTCQNTSLLFNPHRLSTLTKSSRFSVFGALKDPGYVSGLSRAILFDNQYDRNKNYLLDVFRLGINGVQYVNEFQPYVARDLCKKYHVNYSSKVLDPCAGWGGRMIGVSVVSNHYCAFEPASKTFEGLLRLLSFIRDIDSNFRADLYNSPFEDSKLDKDYFDFAITSPPYYDTEYYSDEQTNSLNRYKNFYEWVDRFYLPLINKTMDTLKPGCTFVLNIGSRIYPLNEILISNFGNIYNIEKLGNYLSGTNGLGKSGEGEMFYAVTKKNL